MFCFLMLSIIQRLGCRSQIYPGSYFVDVGLFANYQNFTEILQFLFKIHPSQLAIAASRVRQDIKSSKVIPILENFDWNVTLFQVSNTKFARFSHCYVVGPKIALKRYHDFISLGSRKIDARWSCQRYLDLTGLPRFSEQSTYILCWDQGPF